ncbi:uncharacterized protein LOC116125116 [Pistacia vera]|uniref:uncharacterized protein LOC116125116 n=1 Tax=Pistacia vera TaxID=55513 RepID=UPI00126394F3|nr:uncharacterized protein LOC116125116 [Pistacia vera]
MQSEFEMTDLGEMTYFLGMEINQLAYGIFVSQRKYANEILKKFSMKNCNLVSTHLVQNQKLCKEYGASKVDESMYRSLVGCLLYLTITRPDLMYASGLLSRFMNEPNSDWAGSLDDMRNTSGYAFSLNLGAFCWLSKKQETIAQSSTTSIVAMAKNPILHGLTKHIKIMFHAVREAEQAKEVKLMHYRSEEQLAA